MLVPPAGLYFDGPPLTRNVKEAPTFNLRCSGLKVAGNDKVDLFMKIENYRLVN